MNFDWITNPLTIYAVLMTGGAAALHLVVSTKIEIGRQQQRHLEESRSLRECLAALEGKVAEVCQDAKENTLPLTAYTPFTGLNLHKRAEALRMYRRGNDSHTISTTLGMSQADVELLEKVHQQLRQPAA